MPLEKEAARTVERPYGRSEELLDKEEAEELLERWVSRRLFLVWIRRPPATRGAPPRFFAADRCRALDLWRADLVGDVQTSRRNISPVDPETLERTVGLGAAN